MRANINYRIACKTIIYNKDNSYFELLEFIKKCNMEPARYKKFISRPDVMEALTNKDMNKLDHFIAGAKA